ncbi:hypothetical protein [Kineosporia babensis]|uniref:Uncharacterized protein n=1 Tax=Kineosporia babensis TaxID=499548 RepID=A0A9X1NBY2_9ACTN|nr:hypothetical protein [Kineosporia babensis]MCD5310476.1 hypothetical protein [Kineosporia babensis]
MDSRLNPTSPTSPTGPTNPAGPANRISAGSPAGSSSDTTAISESSADQPPQSSKSSRPLEPPQPSRRSVLAAAGLLPLLPTVKPFGAPAAPKKKTATFAVSYTDFAAVTPSYLTPTQCWNSLGLDDTNRLYINWTSTRSDGREDTALFRYNPYTGGKQFLGSFIDVATAQDNIRTGEQIPKGHTRIVQVGRKLYMASQGFHDFKGAITDLPNYRGAHLFRYDLDTGAFDDISKGLPGGVVIKNEGIVALSYSPEHKLLVCLSHPHGKIILFDPATNTIKKTVTGIPWAMNKMVSREIVVTRTGKIYTYRGPEDPSLRENTNPVWVYDIATGSFTNTGVSLKGGFWNGQAVTADRNKIYLSTVTGNLYRLDVATGAFTALGSFIDPVDYNHAKKFRVMYFYGIEMTADEKQILGWPIISPTAGSGGGGTRLVSYSIPNNKATKQFDSPIAAFTGSNHRDPQGRFYQAAFDWDHNCKLSILTPQ